MANFTTKTIKQVFDAFMAKYNVLRSKYGDNSPLLEKSFIKTIGYAIAGVAVSLWQLTVWIFKQCYPQSCEKPMLKQWGGLIGVDYNDGQAASLTIKLTDVTADFLVSGTLYKDLNSGLTYKTVSQVNTDDGIIITTVQCTTSGEVGNVPAGTILNIANPLDGIPSTAEVIDLKIEGTEDEKTETYRKRVLSGFRKKTETGSPLDYYNWAMSVPGIIDALPYVLTEGTVTLYLVADGSGKDRSPSGELNPNPFPQWVDGNFTEFSGSGQFLQVAQAIEGTEVGVHNRRPVMATVDLKAPNYAALDVEIEGLSDISYNEQIKNAIIGLLDRKKPHLVVLGYSAAGARITQPELSSACINVLNDETFTSFTLKNETGKSVNEITLGIGALAYLKTLTINGEVYYKS